jgi:hypothetical protein
MEVAVTTIGRGAARGLGVGRRRKRGRWILRFRNSWLCLRRLAEFFFDGLYLEVSQRNSKDWGFVRLFMLQEGSHLFAPSY